MSDQDREMVRDKILRTGTALEKLRRVQEQLEAGANQGNARPGAGEMTTSKKGASLSV